MCLAPLLPILPGTPPRDSMSSTEGIEPVAAGAHQCSNATAIGGANEREAVGAEEREEVHGANSHDASVHDVARTGGQVRPSSPLLPSDLRSPPSPLSSPPLPSRPSRTPLELISKDDAHGIAPHASPGSDASALPPLPPSPSSSSSQSTQTTTSPPGQNSPQGKHAQADELVAPLLHSFASLHVEDGVASVATSGPSFPLW